MLQSSRFKRIYIACGYTDLRYGIDGLAATVRERFNLNPFETDILFLFCGRRNDRIKALAWEGDGFLLLYKWLEDGKFKWPRKTESSNGPGRRRIWRKLAKSNSGGCLPGLM